MKKIDYSHYKMSHLELTTSPFLLLLVPFGPMGEISLRISNRISSSPVCIFQNKYLEKKENFLFC